MMLRLSLLIVPRNAPCEGCFIVTSGCAMLNKVKEIRKCMQKTVVETEGPAGYQNRASL
jgi:hypothetical protein